MSSSGLYRFAHSATRVYWDAGWKELRRLSDPASTVIITDDHLSATCPREFAKWNTITIPAGESSKSFEMVNRVIDQLVTIKADRSFTIVGVGGGVVTDLAGFVASIYMRGVRVGYMPTSLLAMVDAAIGGKNGIDFSNYKNLVGTFRQPDFLCYDVKWLKTLPEAEWINGFAEIIKHAVVADQQLFRQLQQQTLNKYRKNKTLLQELVQRNAKLKLSLVQRDERESNQRRLLNFGHTLGHGLEQQYEVAHGKAIAVGMSFAAHLSQSTTGFKESASLLALLDQYQLPTYASFNKENVLEAIRLDKKKEQSHIHYVLLQRIGKAIIKPLTYDQLGVALSEW